MRKNGMWKRIFAAALSATMVFSLPVCAGRAEAQEVDPLGKYDETLTITVGRPMIEVTWPEGQSYEDNVLLDYIYDKLNIKIEYAYDVTADTDYLNQLSLAMTSGDLPDVMFASLAAYKDLVENEYAQDLKDYLVYGDGYMNEYMALGSEWAGVEDLWSYGTSSDGAVYAIPRATMGGGSTIGVFLRADWMEALGISVDEDEDYTITLDELKMVAKEFYEKDPGNSDNRGIVMMTDLSWTQVTSYIVDSAFGVYHSKFFKDEDGKVYYGGVSGDAKAALEWWVDAYKEGLVDPEFTTDDLFGTILEKWSTAKTGIVFSDQDSPTWLFNRAYESDPNARFEFYGIANLDGSGVNRYQESDLVQCLVVREGFEHPEAVIKVYNLIVDLVQSDTLKTEDPALYELVSDPDFVFMDPFLSYFTPLGKNKVTCDVMNAYIKGEAEIEAPADWLVAVKENGGELSTLEPGTREMYDAKYVAEKTLEYYRENDKFAMKYQLGSQFDSLTYQERWTDLFTSEKETWAKIISGELPIEAWDTFVEDWYANGGQDILDEMQAIEDAK